MIRNVPHCLVGDTVETALASMAARQLRWLTVVDETGKVVGVLSKADVARHQRVSEVVSRISDRAARKSRPLVLGALIAVGAGLAGAALMYIFDPMKGRGRRAALKDKIGHFFRESVEKTVGARNDVVNRALGLIAERRARLEPRPVDDIVLVERVRARLGRLVTHPHSVTVAAEKGVVTLSGCIPRVEIRKLAVNTEAIPGVARVINRLEHLPQTEHRSFLEEDATVGVAIGRSRRIA